MSWKLVVWLLVLCTSQVHMASSDVARGKRFMTNSEALPRPKVATRTAPIRLVYLDDYKDWSPSQEYLFPSSSNRRPSGWYGVQDVSVQSRQSERESILNSKLSVEPYSSGEAESRTDKLLLGGEAIAREHAKLVHDINGLLEIHPGWGNVREEEHTTESRDLKEDVYMEDVETREMVAVTTTAPRPAAVNLKIIPRVTSSPEPKPAASLPLIVLGGNAPKITKPNLHPYTFVGAASTVRPLRLPSMMSYGYPMRAPQPTLWQRFVSIFPRLYR